MIRETWRNQAIGLAVFLALCFCVAGLGSMATVPNVPTWYAGLAKPTWTPPGWLFGPVWTLLYFSMAFAAWLVWRRDGWSNARLPLAMFAVQLALNAAWSWLFFAFHCPGLAFFELVLLWSAILATTILFWRRSTAAGVLFVPYLLWVSFAAALNFAIWRLNAA